MAFSRKSNMKAETIQKKKEVGQIVTKILEQYCANRDKKVAIEQQIKLFELNKLTSQQRLTWAREIVNDIISDKVKKSQIKTKFKLEALLLSDIERLLLIVDLVDWISANSK